MACSLGDTAVELTSTPDGRRLVVRRVVDAPVEAVWEALTDTERWPEWGPSITAVDCDDRHVRAGTTGRVRVVGGLWLPFEIETCENYRWTWTVARVPATGHFVDPHQDGSVVGFELPVLAAGYVPVCARACARLADVAKTARNGE
ncbi:SRPBCC family protein [Haloarcula nitratireducens]|uniref:SRPBCC family protein n=1 Tax=Haloarcula nitratireducens TaxID=2487749 RepID=A0AAW4P7Q3_9EURY|nr:SRPBCC family protein [Halomicroarcula nitratireducens]MBX0293970.1 SRPBCC family protein [Halomicroarcula nitratireducens]